MSEIQFPAVIVMSAIRRRNGNGAEVVSFADGKTLQGPEDLGQRIATLKGLEEGGAAGYTYTLAEAARVAEVIDTQRRALEFEAGLRASPDPEPEPMNWAEAVAKAADLARAKWAGQPAMLRRVERALQLVNEGAVFELDTFWRVKCDLAGTWRVEDGHCTCPDFQLSHTTWCKHRIAVALTLRARELQKDGAESAANTSAPELAPEETNTQPQDTTTLDLAQLAEVRPLWGGGLILTDLAGQRIARPELTEAAAAPVLKAAGWQGPLGQGYWRNPTARDWAAIDTQIKAQCDAMIGRWQARQGAA